MLIGFRRFIAPTVIKILYYISLLTIILGGVGVVLYAVVEMGTLGSQQAAKMILAAVVATPLALALTRFMAEIWLVLFEINDRLGDIRDKR
jgi:nucleoside permease NupC